MFDMFDYEIRVYANMNYGKAGPPFRSEVFTINRSMRVEVMRGMVQRLRTGFPKPAYEVEVGIRESTYSVLKGV